MIRALVRREIRAHLIFFLAALALGCAVSWHDEIWIRLIPEGSEFSYYRFFINMNWGISIHRDYPILRSSLLGGEFLLSIALAALLGLLIGLSDAIRGLEPFLLHLPSSRVRIAVAKFLAGAILMLAALLPPFLLRAAWTSTPWGHIGPFRWEMAYPGFIRILAGLPVLASCLWAGLGRGRERTLGIFSTVFAFFGAMVYSSSASPGWAEMSLAAGTSLLLLGAVAAHARAEI